MKDAYGNLEGSEPVLPATPWLRISRERLKAKIAAGGDEVCEAGTAHPEASGGLSETLRRLGTVHTDPALNPLRVPPVTTGVVGDIVLMPLEDGVRRFHSFEAIRELARRGVSITVSKTAIETIMAGNPETVTVPNCDAEIYADLAALGVRAVRVTPLRRLASMAVRDGLLDALGSPADVTVARRPGIVDDVLVVRMPTSRAVPAENRPSVFEDFEIVYEVVAVPTVGRI